MDQVLKFGKYKVVRELGQGSMGIVYEGFDAEIDRRVALKTVRSAGLNPSQREELVIRLRREARAAGRLHHTHIVAVYEFGEESNFAHDGSASNTPFIAMEYVEGRELKSYFDIGERPSLSEVQRIMLELLSALDYAHSNGVVHRDIKPSNIVITKGGTVKLADFGIARLESSTKLTELGSLMGTPCYMAPEQFRGEPVDLRADLYAAGVLMYELLTGRVPFDGDIVSIMYKALHEEPAQPSSIDGDLPSCVDAIVLRAMAKRREDRFQSAAEFRAAIAAAHLSSQSNSASSEDETILRASTESGCNTLSALSAPSLASSTIESRPATGIAAQAASTATPSIAGLAASAAKSAATTGAGAGTLQDLRRMQKPGSRRWIAWGICASLLTGVLLLFVWNRMTPKLSGNSARFGTIESIAIDSSGTLYVADDMNDMVRKVTPAGVVSTLAGSARQSGFEDDRGALARFEGPRGVAVDAMKTVYVADSSNNAVRKITPSGVVTTLAGSSNGKLGSSDGVGDAARFDFPTAIAVDQGGNVFVFDSGNNAVRRITPRGVVTTLARNVMRISTKDLQDKRYYGGGLSVDLSGTVYVADAYDNAVRKITPDGASILVAGGNGAGWKDGGAGEAKFAHPSGVAVGKAGIVYIADTDNNAVRKITSGGVVTTIIGEPYHFGGKDGIGSAAEFANPAGIAVDSAGTVYVSDYLGYVLRKITPAGVVTTLAGQFGKIGAADSHIESNE